MTVEDFRRAHLFGDTNQTPSAIHHRLGKGPLDAAPGNHSHKDKASAWGDWQGLTAIGGSYTNSEDYPGLQPIELCQTLDGEFVKIRGVWRTTTSLTGGSPHKIATLPVGWIPPAYQILPGCCDNGGAGDIQQYLRFNIEPDGDIIVSPNITIVDDRLMTMGVVEWGTSA